MPNYDGDNQSESDSEEGEIEEAEEVNVNISDPFDSTETDEMLRSKKLRRGLMYLKSNHIRSCKDTVEERLHFFKAHIRASMDKDAYWVHVAMSQVSGRVIYCTCQCVQRALGRCSHVGALLLFILRHIRINGFQGMVNVITLCDCPPFEQYHQLMNFINGIFFLSIFDNSC